MASHHANPHDGTSHVVRLAYEVRPESRGLGFTIDAKGPDGPLTDSSLIKIQPRLHALDVAIVTELRRGTTFGQLTERQVGRILPLLAQRHASLNDERLRITDRLLYPRLRLFTDAPPLRLRLIFEDADGDQIDPSEGRLLPGPQAFLLQGGRAHPIECPAPWELTAWVRDPERVLQGDLTPRRRDELTKTLRDLGIPDSDLAALSVQRHGPDTFVVRVLSEGKKEPAVAVELWARYGDTEVRLTNQQPRDVHLAANEGMVERDLTAELNARQFLRATGLRYDRDRECFVQTGERALALLDPHHRPWPATWEIELAGPGLSFRSDLSVDTTVRLDHEQGMLDVNIEVGASGATDEALAGKLIEMRDLLHWLASGKTYVRLADGSYVAPSERVRRALSLIDDLGAQRARVWASPMCAGLLRALGEHAHLQLADEATTAWLDEVTRHREPASVEPPETLRRVMRDYQMKGLDWLAMLHRHRLTGVLADDMGLGKTLQALALLLWVRAQEGKKASLVVAPTSVVTVWRDEAKRFASDLNVVCYQGPPDERRALPVADADLVVTSYGVLRRDAEHLGQVPFRYVILDEAQSAKNAHSQNARSVRALRSERRLALTGTPIENRPEELWATMDFLAPGFLGSLRSFRAKYSRPIERDDPAAKEALRARIAPFVLRRLKGDVAPELPEKVEAIMRCEMGTAQRALYEHVAGTLRQSVQQKIEEVGIQRAHLDILAALTRLRQICCDPRLLPGGEAAHTPPSAKLELFEELMREALDADHRVVIFSQFVEMQKILLASLEVLGVKALWLHGGTRHRDKVVAAFQAEDGPPVIVVSLRAGGTGVTLTRADTVIHYDPWWNPAVEQQATDRAHRLGQTQTVNVYKLVCATSVEERVVALAEKKASLAEALLGADRGTASKLLSTDDVLSLLTP